MFNKIIPATPPFTHTIKKHTDSLISPLVSHDAKISPGMGLNAAHLF